MPGLEIKVEGNDAPEVFRKGILITGITASAARDRSYELTFTAIPYSERYGYRPPLIRRPVMAGTLPARVTSTTANDVYAHIDKDGRYRVNLDFDRDTWKPGFESLWVRQSRPYAGDTYGLHLPLLAGTEVSIAFEDGNPDRPYIAGVKHDSAHTDHVTIQNYKRNVLRTPANNKIRLDDERGKEHIKVSTEYGGKSQLNLGHLVDAGKQQRGEGFELRTGMWGAIRAKKGVFISADAQEKAQGQALDMQAAITQLENALSIAKSLSQAAEVAKAHGADLDGHTSLNGALSELVKAGIVLSAPEGVGIVSPQGVRLGSGESSIGLMAGTNIDAGAMEKVTVSAGDAVSVFARKGGIKLYANQGKVEVEAQNERMRLTSRHGMKISSTEDVVEIEAEKELVLKCGKAYIRLSGGGVEVGGPKNILLKSANVQKMSKAQLPVEMPVLPGKGNYDLSLDLRDWDGIPIGGAKYTIAFESGAVLSGMLDDKGYALHTNVPPESATVEYEFPEPEPDKPWDPYSSLLASVDAELGTDGQGA